MKDECRRQRPAAGVHALRDEYTRTIAPTRALAAETLKLERALNDLVNQAYALTPAEIALMWQTAPPRMHIPSSSSNVGAACLGTYQAEVPPPHHARPGSVN
jgi:hypothetical protein